MEEIQRCVKQSRISNKQKCNMLRLAEYMQRKQSVDIAAKEMNLSNSDLNKLLRHFEKLGISPIPLWKNFCATSIPGPISLIRKVTSGDVDITYKHVKYK